MKGEEEWDGAEVEAEPVPEWVAAVPRFRDDVKALMRLTKGDKPPLKGVRGKKNARAFYGFLDASGSGFWRNHSNQWQDPL